ncbi:MAG: hypothetical protein ABEJ26_04340 [Halosimplex sp.]
MSRQPDHETVENRAATGPRSGTDGSSSGGDRRASPEVGPCRHCGRRVPVAAVCRACGYDADPERNRRARFVWGLLGGLLVLSVAGAPLGVVFLWKALGHHRAMTGRVVAGEDRPSVPSAVVGELRRRFGGGRRIGGP